MPSLSILKRSGRDAPPWSLRSWNNPSDNIETPEATTTREEIMPVSSRSCAGSPTADNIFGSNSRSYENNGTDLQGVSIPGPMTTTISPFSPTNKDRRDSKRDLLHGLISRSIRGAGRALSTSSPPSPPSSQSASTTSLSPLSSSVGFPTSTTATASTAPSLFASPPQTSSPSSFHARKPRTAVPAPQKLFRPRPRQSSAAPAYSGASASSKTKKTALQSTSPKLRPRAATSVDTAPFLPDPSRSIFVNANKPLPSRPPPGSEQDVGPPAKPVLKLDRIMASLTDDDVEKLFSGAPQYFARSEGHFTGAPHPSVAYPWDESLGIRDLTDHVQIEDAAWGNVTAWPHITRRCSSSSVAASISSIGADPAEKAGAASSAAGGRPPTQPSSSTDNPKKRSHFYPRCRERPSMLSIQGLEKGTVGYEAALELSVADGLQEEQFGFDNLGNRPNAVIEARKKLMDPIAASAAGQAAGKGTQVDSTDPLDDNANGVKHVGETQILEELIKNGRRYVDGTFYVPNQSKQFYNELFHHILRAPPKRPRSSSGHHKRSGSGDLDADLIPQIEALLDVLATPNVWIDFSHVEWRLRLGQVLWASSPQDEFDPGVGYAQQDGANPTDAAPTPTPRPATCDERYTERYWLLLQILLATELLLRLDAITDGDEYGLEYVHPSEVHRFEKVANPSVRWSLMLARAWLENIEVVRVDEEEKEEVATAAVATTEKEKEKPAVPDRPSSRSSSISARRSKRESGKRHTLGWITTLTKKLSLIEDHLHTSKAPEKKHVYAMRAKNATRQYRGVAHFAQELKWPNDLIGLMSQRALDADRIREPLNNKITDPPTPRTSSSTVSSTSPCAPQPSAGDKGNLTFSRVLPRRRKVVAALHPGGWLSRSYLSGLILPGDSLCNLLMSTLLEGDDEALKTLGPVAHLGAGFVYGGKSFWSTACIVGRVLSAGAGAAECMGWVSSDVLPHNLGEGWVNIDVDDVAEDMRKVNRRARLWGKTAIERESSVLGDAEPESVLPADFVIPYEAVYKQVPPKNTRVDLQRFQLYTAQDPNRPPKKAGDGSIEPADRAAEGDTEMPKGRVGPYAAEASFVVSSDGGPGRILKYNLSYDIYFVTAHPCVPSQRVKVVKSPSSPTIQQIDVTGDGAAARSSTIHTVGHPLHKFYKYASIHLTTLIDHPTKSLEQLLKEYAATPSYQPASPTATSSSPLSDNAVLVIDCITGFLPQPAAHEMPMSPVVDRKHSVFSFDGASSSISSFPPLTKEISPIVALSPAAPNLPNDIPESSTSQQPHIASCVALPSATPSSSMSPAPSPAPRTVHPTDPAASKMHHETRRRRFGSDMEMLVRALCAERGWNALVSRRRRGCLACAIREAGALGWRVVIRVD